MVLADGGAARAVQDQGLASALPSYIGANGIILWPETPALIGPAAAASATASASWLQSTSVFWQPLRLVASADTSIALAYGTVVLAGQGGDGRTRSMLGKYLMVWVREGEQLRIGAWLLSGVAAPPLASSGEVPEISVTTPEPLAAAEHAFYRDVKALGPVEALGQWLAPDGVTFAANGQLNIGGSAASASLAAGGAGDDAWVVSPRYGGMAASAEIGWTIGDLAVRATPDAAPMMHRMLVLWQRNADGEWRIMAAGANAAG